MNWFNNKNCQPLPLRGWAGLGSPALLLATALLLFLPALLSAAEPARTGFLSVSPDNPFFPFLVLFGMAMGALTFFQPKLGLAVMLFFIMVSTDLPTKGESVGARAVTIRIEDLVLVLVSGGWLLNRARTRSLSMFKSVPVNQAILPMALLIVMCTIVGYFQGTVRLQSGLLFSMKRLQYFWIFFMTLNLIDTEREARLAIKLFFGAAAAIALIGAVQFFAFPFSELARGGATATTGFGRANTFASFLLTVIGLVLGLMIYADNPRRLWLAMGALALFAGALLMTKSRGAYVSLLPLLATIIFVTRSRRLVAVLGLAVALLGGYFTVKLATRGAAGLLISRHHDDIGYQINSIGRVAREGIEVDSSLNARYAHFWQDVEKSLEYPLFGHGVGSVPLAWFDVHYKRELHETGLLGMLAFGFMNGVILLTMLKFYRRTRDLWCRGLAIGFLGGHVGILVHALTIENFYTIFNMEAFWFFLALLMVLYHHEERRGWREEETQAEMPAPPAPPVPQGGTDLLVCAPGDERG